MSYLAARRPGAAGMKEAVDLAIPDGRRDWQRLVRAEQDTADALEGLGPGWLVLHSVPVGPGRATLAHLLIGPGGLFAIVSVPPPATVVDVVDGQARLSMHGIDETRAHARQLAQRVRTALTRRLAGRADTPVVHPIVCLTGQASSHSTADRDDFEVLPVARLTAYVHARPRRVTTVEAQRLASLAGEPATWDAPDAEWLPEDLQARYMEATGLSDTTAARVPPPAAEGRVVDGTATASGPSDFPARGAAVRTASVVMVLLGAVSLGTAGLLSPPSLAYGWLFLCRRGGLARMNNKDWALFLVGLVLAGLPLLIWVLFLPVVLVGAG